jgi:hypothetical protein
MEYKKCLPVICSASTNAVFLVSLAGILSLVEQVVEVVGEEQWEERVVERWASL